MKKSKKIFLLLALIFILIILFIVVDMGRRTTFPGSDKIEINKDTNKIDSTKN